MSDYQELFQRNQGYISEDIQNKIRSTSLLIAGCGIGSQVAECAARLGFEKFELVDRDTVDTHNLNRQFFFADQVGKLKTESLKSNILRINSQARVECHSEPLAEGNAEKLVSRCDMIIDTIDFLDLPAITALHDQAHRQKKTLISSFSAGFGAAVLYIPPSPKNYAWIRDIFQLPQQGPVSHVSYVERYIGLFSKLAARLDPQVVQVMQPVFQAMADGKVCPAPQISPGAHSVANLCMTAVFMHLQGRSITTAPEILISSPTSFLTQNGLRLA